MRKSRLYENIKINIKTGKTKEPFRAKDFSFLSKSRSFLSKHRVDNPGGYKEYFIRISRGLYKLK